MPPLTMVLPTRPDGAITCSDGALTSSRPPARPFSIWGNGRSVTPLQGGDVKYLVSIRVGQMPTIIRMVHTRSGGGHGHKAA
jgi:hypothetical protein